MMGSNVPFVIKDLIESTISRKEKPSSQIWFENNMVALTILRLLVNKKLKQHVRWAYV